MSWNSIVNYPKYLKEKLNLSTKIFRKQKTSLYALLLLLFFLPISILVVKKSTWLVPKAQTPNQSADPGNAYDFIPDIIFGKAGFGEIVPNQVTGNRVFLPAGITVDRGTSPNRIYVWDSGNSRILGFTSLGTCESGANTGRPCTNNLDCPSSVCQINSTKNADLVFGQPDLFHAACNGDSTIKANPSAATLCSQRHPNQISLIEGPEPNNMAVDQNHNLYVVDKWNNRALKYNDPFNPDKTEGKGDNIADQVWGQPDFFSRSCNRNENDDCHIVANPTSNSLCLDCHNLNVINSEFNSSGLDVEPDGSRLWIADGANHRVLRFPADSGDADLVIGQPDFSSRNPNGCVSYPNLPAEDALCRPKVAKYSPLTNQLYILDWADEINLFRILIYDPPFTNNKMAPSEIIYGGPTDQYRDLIVNQERSDWSYHRLSRPLGLALDPFAPSAFWLTDNNHNRALYFQKIAGKWQPTKVLPQPNLERIQKFGSFNCSNLPEEERWRCFVNPSGSAGIDSEGNIYLESNFHEQILRFSAPIPTPLAEATGDEGIGYAAENVFLKQQENASADQMVGINFIGPAGIHTPNAALTVNYTGGAKQLFVQDKFRVLVWNDYTNKVSNSPADYVLFQNDFNSQLTNVNNQANNWLVRQMVADSQGRIWMAKESQGVYVFQGPISTSPATPTIIPLTLNLKNSSRPINLGLISGLAYDENEDCLWVADADNYRVVRINHPLDPNQRIVDLVLGQPNLDSIKPNRSKDDRSDPQNCPNMQPDSFASLSKIYLDNFKNLYVVDATHELAWCSNNRLIEYDKTDLTAKLEEGKVFLADNELVPKRVYGRSGFTTSEKNKYSDENKPNAPFSISFTSDNRMLIGAEGYGNKNYKRIYLLNNPLPNCQTSCRVDEDYLELAPGAIPQFGLSYLIPLSVSQPDEVFWDKSNNLIVLDHAWSRVLFFKTPLPPAPTPTNVPNCATVGRNCTSVPCCTSQGTVCTKITSSYYQCQIPGASSQEGNQTPTDVPNCATVGRNCISTPCCASQGTVCTPIVPNYSQCLVPTVATGTTTPTRVPTSSPTPTIIPTPNAPSPTSGPISGPIIKDFSSVADTFIYNSAASENSNFGSQGNLRTSFWSSTDIRQSLIKFELSEIPVSANVTSAILSLESVAWGGKGTTVSLYKLLQDWDELTVTWKNKPNQDTLLLGSFNVTSLGKHQLNLTPIVQSWINNPNTNKGLLLKIEVKGFDLYFASRENNNLTKRPKLTVTYTIP
ncbi:MAG TPA: DNRLRE domain-containing protein [Candidatus Woesebacteria bacterium]|nr:DNRLRE domain-containing protein [Candidatus Woesebacteria bacterium]